MGRLVFLTEEKSMAETLRVILPKIKPDCRENLHWVVIPHSGKSDLEKSIPVKMKGWREPGVRFIILRDNDGGDCRKLKRRLASLAASEPAQNVCVRIVCQELENWFLGDIDAIQQAFPESKIGSSRHAAKFRTSDSISNASEELFKLVGSRAKVGRAKKIAGYMVPNRNSSQSFQALVGAVIKSLE